MLDFFINRPIFAATIALLMIICGGISIVTLPISQYPEIVPPTVTITSAYPGASAEVTADTVTTLLEDSINGIQGMIYMSSTSVNNGTSYITVTFDVGYSLDIGAVDVQNRVSQVQGQIPQIVNEAGIIIDKTSTDMVLVVSLTSPEGTYDDVWLGNYADIYLNDPLLRVPGVGSITNFGLLEYSMRIWLDPDKMASLELTVSDVKNAVQEQNQQVAAGLIGSPPTTESPAYQLQISTLGQLKTAEQFENIIVRTGPDGQMVTLADIGRVELGAQNYQQSSSLNAKPAGNLGIYQLPGANALTIKSEVVKVLEGLSQKFPDDVEYELTYDTTEFVRLSIEDLVVTLLEALALVIFVVFVFLQSWRSTLIPVIAIPVSLIGAFAFMMVFGFSINTLSLLGLVLAVGLVVDDAIVVVENVERQLEAHPDWTRTQATSVAMHEVVGPIIATTLVLLAVFVPTAFMPGITGQLYNQFALTIAFSVLLSSVNSLTLSPALCAIFLKPTKLEDRNFLFRAFNNVFDKVIEFYGKLLHWFIKLRFLVFAAYLVLAFFTGFLLLKWPQSFVPTEDQGYCFGLVQLPAGSTVQRTTEVIEEMAAELTKNEWVDNVISVGGFNFLTSTSQTYTGFVIPIFKSWGVRGKQHTANKLILEFNEKYKGDPRAGISFVSPPPIMGLGTVGGFQLQLENLPSVPFDQFYRDCMPLIEAANKSEDLMMVRTTSQIDVPQIWLDVDREKAKLLGVNLTELFDTLQVQLGSLYINNFNLYNQTYQVQAQAEGWARSNSNDIGQLFVQSQDGSMIPLDALVTVENITGPDFIPHYNLYETLEVLGSPNVFAGKSSGQAITAMEQLCDEYLPPEYAYEWSGTTYQELAAGNLAPIIFGLALIVVFLLLAAQYESWILPIMIMLVVPLAMLGAVLALMVAKRPLDVYGQIGLVTLIGLAAKNAILIVEFAKELGATGQDPISSAIGAAKLRLRPILMTAFSFILGVVPLVLASGAGAQSRQSIGYVVFGGMLVATVITLGVVPVFYVIFEHLREKFGVDPTYKIGAIEIPADEDGL
ncbi:MAG: hydrophobe/amphiphile efflux-1 family RND transporter [Planctomycetes bacterium TMED75]|nr:hydrophobe/amphiphile efflux-1 family RND transporter [Planctomycetaceae bacterium]OUU90435.1 MAG: hydrophobe/amphiphile efflux-1 family RND transporter [Planctomycetes bacterium TMED75]